MGAMDRFKQQAKKDSKQNRQNRVTKKQKHYNKAPSKSDIAYVEGNYKKVASNRAYGYRQGVKNGEIVKGTDSDWLNPNKIRAKGEVKENKLWDKYETSKPKKGYIEWDTREEGGKFKDRLKTGKLDGLAIAKENQRKGKHVQNTLEYIKGGAKDLIGDPVVDALKTFDRVESAVTGGLGGVFEQAGNVFRGTAESNPLKYWDKGRIKDNVDVSLKESDETGWGMGMSHYLKGANERAYQNDLNFYKEKGNDYMVNKLESERSERKKQVDKVAGGAGFALDILNPVSIADGASKTVRFLGKNVINSGKDLVRGTTDISTGFVPKELTDLRGKYGKNTKPLRNASGASDDVFHSSKAFEDLKLFENGDSSSTKINNALDRGFDNSVNKVDKTPSKVNIPNKPKLNSFLEELDKSIPYRGTQTTKPTMFAKNKLQLKDGYVPNLIKQADEVDNVGKSGVAQRDFFKAMNSDGSKKITYNTNKERVSEFMKFNPTHLDNPSDELKSVIERASKVDYHKPNEKKQIIKELNDTFFDSKPVIHNEITDGAIKELTQKIFKQKPEQFMNNTLKRISGSLTDPTYQMKRKYLKEFGGIGDYYKYKQETEAIMKKLDSKDLTPLGRVKLNSELRTREQNILRRNKLASEIYPLEGEEFLTKYGDNIGKNPLNIKQSDWNNNNQIKELSDSGVLSDIAKRTDYDPQQTFKPSPSEVTSSDSKITNQKMWQIANLQNGGKSVGYYDKVIQDNRKSINNINKAIDELNESQDFASFMKVAKLEESKKALNEDNKKLLDSRKQVIKSYNELKNGLASEVDIDGTLDDILTELKPNAPKQKKSNPYNYSNLDNSKESNIARGLAKQHDVRKPISIVDSQDVESIRYNKQQIQKLVQLRVKQQIFDGVDKSSNGVVMGKALDKLISEHMSNMKKYLPTQYNELTQNLNKYKNSLTRKYMDYKNATDVDLSEGFVLKRKTNPLDKINDKFYSKKDTKGSQHGDNLGKEINALGKEFIEGGLPKFEENKYINDADKLADIDKRLKDRITPGMIIKASNAENSIFDDVFGRGSKIDDMPNNAPKAQQNEMKYLTTHGIDPSVEPPKQKPKNMEAGLYRRWLNSWKKGVTVYNPGWHVQNYFQNKGQNYLALGNDALKPNTNARQILKEIQGKSNKAKGIVQGDLRNGQIKGNYSPSELANLAKKHGVIDSYGDDVVQAKGIFSGLETKVDNSKIMNKLGESEQTARLHHFLTQMERGMNPEEASKSVNKYLFDYSKSSPLEDKVLKNIDPFWTFHKNYARLMGQSMIEHPSKINNINRATRGLDEHVPNEQKQSEENSYGKIQQPHANKKDKQNGADYNYLFEQQMFPEVQDAIPTDKSDIENKLNPLIRIADKLMRNKGNFDNDVVEGKPGWNEISKEQQIKEMVMDVNPFMPTLVNALDKNKNRQEKADKDKVSQEMTDKQILNEWIKYITGYKGNWYRNIK